VSTTLTRAALSVSPTIEIASDAKTAPPETAPFCAWDNSDVVGDCHTASAPTTSAQAGGSNAPAPAPAPATGPTFPIDLAPGRAVDVWFSLEPYWHDFTPQSQPEPTGLHVGLDATGISGNHFDFTSGISVKIG